MAKSAKAAQVIKRKRWVQIIAPKVFNEQVIGETYISDFQDAIGKEVSVSLMVLTGDPQKQSVSLSFKMIGVNNNVITTQALGCRIVPSAVRKTMRRGKEKIEDSFILTTQDNVRVLVKPLMVTKGRPKGSVLANLRRTMRAQLAKMLAASTFENVLVDLVMHKFQRTLSDGLRKIYPLSTCELKQFSVVKDTKQVASQAPKEPVPLKTEEPVEQPVQPAVV